MKELKLVTVNQEIPMQKGMYVIPHSGSGLKFKIGEVIEVKDQNYVIVCIGQQNINVIVYKLQPVKLYLVKKERFAVGDLFYYPPTIAPKTRTLWRDYDAKIGKIGKEIDAKLFNLGNAQKVIFKPEQIGLMRYKSNTLTHQINDIGPVDSTVIVTIINNGGNCLVEDELIEGKVVISYETIQ